MPSPSIPGYILFEELGRGGMGVVYLAYDQLNDRKVALKVMRNDRYFTSTTHARFRSEADKLARLRHKNIVEVFQAGVTTGAAYYAMEYLKGGTLASRLQDTMFGETEAAVLILKLATAVQHLHQQGLIHRDLKPANILLTEEDEPKLADFGLARYLESDQDLTASDAVLGTAPYMAPEQVRGPANNVGSAADIYGLGAILYQLLTGIPLYQSNGRENTLHLICTVDPKLPSLIRPGISRNIETICIKCLHKDPNERYSSATALVEDLENFISQRPIKARRYSYLRLLKTYGRKHMKLLVMAVLVIVCVTIIGIGYAEREMRFGEETDRQISEILRSSPADMQQYRERFIKLSLNSKPFLEKTLELEPPGSAKWVRAQLMLLPHAPYHVDVLYKQLLSCTPAEYRMILEYVRCYHEQLFCEWLGSMQQTSIPSDLVRIAAACIYIGENYRPDVWSLFSGSEDQSIRTTLIHWLPESGVPISTIFNHLCHEPNSKSRTGLFLTLSGYRKENCSSDLLHDIINYGQETYKTDLDPGVHASSGFLLRSWGENTWLEEINALLRNASPQTRQRWFVTRIGISMVIVPPAFGVTLGCSEKEMNGNKKDLRHYKVNLAPFAIGATEVTWKQFWQFRPEHQPRTKRIIHPDEPVYDVSILDAQAFCDWLSRIENRRFGLPTEDQWEYAARGGTTTQRHFGTVEDHIIHYCNYVKNSSTRPCPVASFMPNDYGLFDTLGNVKEWCIPSTFVLDERQAGPLLFQGQLMHYRRGGYYSSSTAGLRVNARGAATDLNARDPDVGFRVVANMDTGEVHSDSKKSR